MKEGVRNMTHIEKVDMAADQNCHKRERCHSSEADIASIISVSRLYSEVFACATIP